MPKKIKTPWSETWTVAGDDKTWVLGKNASIITEGVPALLVAAGSDGNTVRLLGQVESDGPGAMAAIIRGTNTTLTLGKAGSIEASIGINVLADGNRIVSNGDIIGLNAGIRSTHQVSIEVAGELVGGHHGIELEGAIAGSEIAIARGGSVSGGNGGIAVADGTDVSIINRGEIRSDALAIDIASGDATIVNRGKISGDIETGDGHDHMDLRKGSVAGEVRGGSGSDHYYVSSQAIDIVEDAAHPGLDRIYSKVTYTIQDNVEALMLIGKRAIDAYGNAGNNMLSGNDADNALHGGDGDDILKGFGGRDLLTGGNGADHFLFEPGSGRDTIADFVNGDDMIHFWNFDGIEGFADIESRMTQHGADVWIELNAKDRIILKDVSLLDLDELDFTAASGVT